MIFGYAILLVALAISAVAEYYSIMGLVAIFAAASTSIMIMGGALGLGKIFAIVWCHQNWHRAKLLFKAYLIPAILFLMFLTSMGIFGFLSKAHLDQGVPSGDVVGKIELIDTKIVTQRENIETTRKVLKQMDAAVDEVMARSKNEQGARNSNQLRINQAKDRVKLQDEISKAQTSIAALNEERSIISRDLRKIEAEVGPVKYVAALIYGDNPDANLLEKAVRWVIILLVGVFDPLAMVLILCGVTQLIWAKEARVARRKEKEKAIKTVEDLETISAAREDAIKLLDKTTEENKQLLEMVSKFQDENNQLYGSNDRLATDYEQLAAEAQTLKNEIVFRDGEITHRINDIAIRDNEIGRLQTVLDTCNTDIRDLMSANTTLNANVAALQSALIPAQNLEAMVLQARTEAQESNESEQRWRKQLIEITTHADQVLQAYALKEQQFNELNADQLKQAEILASQLQAGQLAENVIQELRNTIDTLRAEVDQLKLDRDALANHIATLPQEVVPFVPEPVVDTLIPATTPRADFGTEFPSTPARGDMFLRTDFKPSRLFKWNDLQWLQINKSTTDVFLYSDAYLQFLIEKLQSREYDWDDLSTIEQQQIEIINGGQIV